ncbi:MAG: hypothetical protein LLG00_08425 [Planctomycetaceae bacterium]|nr:hypothetical protein [Planctomycetaceae bacterium]
MKAHAVAYNGRSETIIEDDGNTTIKQAFQFAVIPRRRLKLRQTVCIAILVNPVMDYGVLATGETQAQDVFFVFALHSRANDPPFPLKMFDVLFG